MSINIPKGDLVAPGGIFRPNKAVKGGIYYFYDNVGKKRPHILVSNPDTYGYNRLHKFFMITSVSGVGKIPFVVSGNKVSYINCFRLIEMTAAESVASSCPSGLIDDEFVEAMISVYLSSFDIPVKASAIDYLLKYAEAFNNTLEACAKTPNGAQLVSSNGTLESVERFDVSSLLEGVLCEKDIPQEEKKSQQQVSVAEPVIIEVAEKTSPAPVLEKKKDPLEVRLGIFCDDFLGLSYSESNKIMALADQISDKFNVLPSLKEDIKFATIKWLLSNYGKSSNNFTIRDIERSINSEVSYSQIYRVCRKYINK